MTVIARIPAIHGARRTFPFRENDPCVRHRPEITRSPDAGKFSESCALRIGIYLGIRIPVWVYEFPLIFRSIQKSDSTVGRQAYMQN